MILYLLEKFELYYVLYAILELLCFTMFEVCGVFVLFLFYLEHFCPFVKKLYEVEWFCGCM